jgi:hypothetical protein
MILLFLQSFLVFGEGGDFRGETLSSSDSLNSFIGFVTGFGGVSVHGLPVIEHTLREGLSASVRSKIGGEAEGLHDRQVSSELHHGGARSLFLREHNTSSSSEHTVAATDSILRHLDITQVHRLEHTRAGRKDGREGYSSSRGHDLTHTSVDSIGVKSHIEELDANVSASLIGHRSLLDSPVEASDDRFLDFVQVVDTLGVVNEEIGSVAIRSEGPDLSGFTSIPSVVIDELSGSSLHIFSGVDLTIFDGISKAVLEGVGSAVKSIVLVGGLGETVFSGFTSDSFSERHDRVGDVHLSAHEIFLEILEADLKMELTSASNDVLSRFLGVAENHRIRLGQSLHTFDELGQVTRVLRLNSHSDDGRHGELHGLDAVGGLGSGDSTGLEEVVIDTDEAASVTSGDILNLFNISTHLNESSLDVLHPKISLLAGHVVRSKDSDSLTSGDLAGEHSAESVESTLIGGGYHLRHVHTERSGLRGIAVLDSKGDFIIEGTIVESRNSVSLGNDGRRKVDDNHLQHSIGSREPLLHDSLEELLASEVSVLTLQHNTGSLEHLLDLGSLVVHDSIDHLGDGVHDELTESSLEGTIGIVSLPLLVAGVKEPVAPKLLHHSVFLNTELLGVDSSESLEGETPLVETRAESDGTVIGVHLNITKDFVHVSGDNHVHRLNSSRERLVHLLRGELKLEESSIHLVDHEHRLHSLTNGLSEHSFGLYAHTFDAINNDESTVSHSKSSSHLRREINVAWRINEVDQERVLVDLNLLLLSRSRGFLNNRSRSLLLALLLISFLSLLFGGGLLVGSSSVGLTFSHSNSSLLGIAHFVLKVHRNTSRFDGNTSLLFIFSGIGKSSLPCELGRDDTGLRDKRVGKGGLAVVHVSNNRHVSDVPLKVHHFS